MWAVPPELVSDFSPIASLIGSLSNGHDDFEVHCIPCCRARIGKLLRAGNGCAPESGAPIAWDGLGSAPTDDTQPVEPQPRKHARAKREAIVGPLDAAATVQNNKVQPKDQWEQQQAADQDDEARLKRKLVICQAC